MSNLWDCPQCGAKGNDGLFCPECGARTPILYCTTCKEVIKTKFCKKCGQQTTPIQIIDRGDYIEFSPDIDGLLYMSKKMQEKQHTREADRYLESLPKIEGLRATFPYKSTLLELCKIDDFHKILKKMFLYGNEGWCWTNGQSEFYIDIYGDYQPNFDGNYYNAIFTETGEVKAWHKVNQFAVLACYYKRS